MSTRNFIRSCRPGLLGRLPAYLLGAILSAGLVFSVNSYAVHDINVFELDNGQLGANAIDESNIGNADASAPDDWAKVGGCPNGLASCGYVAGPTVEPNNPGGSAFMSVFIQDPNGVANSDDIFAGGGSKDDLDVKQWLVKRGSAPDKDDLLPLGAAAYRKDLSDDGVDNPDLLIYLFGTLFAPNGSAAIGAWLFKKDIGICDDGINGNDTDPFGVVDSDGNCLPPAQQPLNLHSIGDVFVVAENVNGGRVVIMEVYNWVDENNAQGQDTAAAIAAKNACTANGGSLVNGTLCRVFANEDAHCDITELMHDDACGTMNLGETKGKNAQPAIPTESPDDWGFQSKFPPANGPASPPGTDGIQSNDFPGTSLFEAGFNFSNLFPGAEGCFNTFLMNTRASHSVDATLKDIGMGKFPLCGVSVSKSGPEKSKIGDDADFTFTVTNTGAITLYLDSIVDDVLGDLEADAVAAGCATLVAGASCNFVVSEPIPANSPDPLVNTVTVHYNTAQNLQGDDQASTDSHSTNLFQPSITFDKSGDAQSKVGDPINYVITLNNTSSTDTPDLECTITDPTLGLDVDVTLASGASHVLTPSHVVQAGDPDPLVNTASVTCSPQGFPNIYEASDSHSTNLFQPGVTLTKTGDALSKVGDPVNYTITLSNTSSAGSPDMQCTLSDPLLGISQPVTLAAGASHVINAQYIVPAGATDPLPNTASATCSPQGFPNVFNVSASHNVNLFQPSVTVDKTGDTLKRVGGLANYTIVVSNTSSADSPNLVNGTIVDTLLGNLLDPANPYVVDATSDCTSTLAPGTSCTINASRTVLAGDADPLPNTVTVHYNPSGFPNDISDSDDHQIALFNLAIGTTFSCEPADGTGPVLVGENLRFRLQVTNQISGTGAGLVPPFDLTGLLTASLGTTGVLPAACTALAVGTPCVVDFLYQTTGADVGATLQSTASGTYTRDGVNLPVSITSAANPACGVLLPNPATVVIEKLLLNASNLAFNYSATGLPVPGFQLVPLFGQLPLGNSPFADPLAGQSFASSIEYTVDIPIVGTTKQVTVTENEPLPPFVSPVSLTCAAADGGTLTGQSVVGLTATLTLGSGDFAFCRYVNEEIAPSVGVLIIDEDSIDNNDPAWWDAGVIPGPNNGNEFSDIDVNDQKADEGLRDVLAFFASNVGLTLQLFTGQVGDEGWFAPQFIPTSWNAYGPNGDGLRAYVDGSVPQNRLDKIKNVTPLRAEGLHGLEGGTYCAVVYDSDISINYGPLNGNLQGANYGIVAFEVLIDGVIKAEGFSSSSLPTVTITILDALEVCGSPLELVNAPKPPSSSEPFDIDPEDPTGGYQ